MQRALRPHASESASVYDWLLKRAHECAADDEDSYTKEETKSTKFVNLVHAASLSRQASGQLPPVAMLPAAGSSGSAPPAAAARAAPIPDSNGPVAVPRAAPPVLERAAATSAPTALSDEQVRPRIHAHTACSCTARAHAACAQVGTSPGNGHAWPALGGATWAAKATVAGAAAAPAAASVLPPAANALEWPQLPGAGGEAGEGADARPASLVPPLARTGSTMAAQLARAASVPNGAAPTSALGASGGVLVVAKGKKLMPLSPVGKPRPAAKPALTPLGPVVAAAAATPALPSPRGELPSRAVAPEAQPPTPAATDAARARPAAAEQAPLQEPALAPALSKRKQKLAAKQEAAAVAAAAATAAAAEEAARREAALAAEARLIAQTRQREAEATARSAAVGERQAGAASAPADKGDAAASGARGTLADTKPAGAALGAADAPRAAPQSAAPPRAPSAAGEPGGPRANKGPPPGFAVPQPAPLAPAAAKANGSSAPGTLSPFHSVSSESSAASAHTALPEFLAVTGDALLLPGLAPGVPGWSAGAPVCSEGLWLGPPLAEVAAAGGLPLRPRQRSRFDFAQGCDEAGSAGGAPLVGRPPAVEVHAARGDTDAYLRSLFLPVGGQVVFGAPGRPSAPVPQLTPGAAQGWRQQQAPSASLTPALGGYGGATVDVDGRGTGLELLRQLQQHSPQGPPSAAYAPTTGAYAPASGSFGDRGRGTWAEAEAAGGRGGHTQPAARPGGPPPGFATTAEPGPHAQPGGAPLLDVRWLEERVHGDVHV